MVPEEKIQEFVKRAREAAGENLESVILYGSAASGKFDPEFSDINLLCLLRDTGFDHIAALGRVASWWHGQKQPAPLVMTRAELESTTDVFTIELLDMKRHHRVLFGDDVLQGLEIPMNLHRVQVEFELRQKLILLRQRTLLARKEEHLWKLLLQSAPSFVTLFRHALMAMGHQPPEDKREVVQQLSKVIGFDPAAIERVLAVREHQATRGKATVYGLMGDYLAAVEKVTAAVDKALDPRTK
ncbi:MAG: nucleotidyltransferase domain-containing protein [Acidobacteriaceae bacterium]